MNSRRKFLKQSSLGISVYMASPNLSASTPALKGNIKQIVAAWPFMATGPKWSPEEFLKQTTSLGNCF